MPGHSSEHATNVLERIAVRAMTERGFLSNFSTDALNELGNIHGAVTEVGPSGRDLRKLLWASIDNDDSKDLDQLTVAQSVSGSSVRVLVAVADVAAMVKKASAIDAHARQNTTSVYTAAKTFPMLPERLSTDLTSLNNGEDRAAIVVDVLVDGTGEIENFEIYRALVRSHAKLAYNSAASWLEGKLPKLDAVESVPGLAENLRLQDKTAQMLRALRHKRGALDLQTLEARPVFSDGEVVDLQAEETNRAKQIIEDFMIAANDVTARFLREKNVPSLRRVVRSPKRWDRIVEIAAQYKAKLPPDPDPVALARFLTERRAADPLRFPDLSLSIIKLLGPGEYVVELPDETSPGHFGLALKDYTHSTAPNRRFPDLITQRILKATLDGSTVPYSRDELVDLARHCTLKEDDANKVERSVGKSAAAMLLSSRIGDGFDAICTGAADKGTWVRVFQPPVEGRLVDGYEGVDVGDRLRVRLVNTDVERGYIDFARLGSSR